MWKEPKAKTCQRAVIAAGTASLLALAGLVPAWADGGVDFTDIAAGDQNGISFRRMPTLSRLALKQDIESRSPIFTPDFFGIERPDNSPQKAAGVPGLVLFDYDNDGDKDIYVTNGPDYANSLYSNQLVETGSVTFVDVGLAAGVDATDQDSTGACAGDIDNDGDADLYVVATGEPNRLFENLGNGSFADVTAAAGVGGDGRHANGCSFGDVDNDGLLDLVVANSYDDWNHRKPVFVFPFGPAPTYPGMEHNYLFSNSGGNVFSDVSAASGIENVSNMSGPGLTGAGFSWAIAVVDLDLDGDADILVADNQGPPSVGDRTLERGWNRFFQNDGSGNFTDVTEAVGLDVEGSWMGLSFADFDCNGHMDFFSTDLGNYLRPGGGAVPAAASRWFLQDGGGNFSYPGLGPDILGDPFGWGTATLDYDNDGDTDILYHGGVDLLNVLIADNPGVIFQNTGQCSAQFVWDDLALPSRDHRLRSVQSVAVGDLDNDGFTDIVTAANFQIVPVLLFPMVGVFSPPTFGPFDAVARAEVVWAGLGGPNQNFLDIFGHVPPVPGDLAVEINSADNGNNSAAFSTLGGAGTLPAGNNRDGIGAVLFFTPDGGPTSMQPVLGGSSYAARNALEKVFGMGAAASGTLDVLWPGGVRNRLYDVTAGERLLIPEIPCSFDAAWANFGQYNSCVMQALNTYKDAGFLTDAERNRLRDSARRAFDESQ